MLARFKPNEDKSGASFCCQVPVMVPDIFCNFYLVKIYKFAFNSTATKAKEKQA